MKMVVISAVTVALLSAVSFSASAETCSAGQSAGTDSSVVCKTKPKPKRGS